MWLLLDPRPGWWNGDKHRAWRFHPEELNRGVERFYAAGTQQKERGR